MARRARERGRIEFTTVASRVLRGNPLGDPAVRTFPVYLPPGYDAGTARYPVVLALAGFTGTGRSFLHGSAWGESLDARLDRLLAAGRIGPMIVAMPDCFTRYGGSQYIDSGATGRYGTHLVREVVPHLDRTFRTLPRARHRGLIGKSSGGYGALVHAMKHADAFGAVAAHSADMMAPRHTRSLRRLRLLFFDVGRLDEYNLLWGARQLASTLRRLGVAMVYEEFDDGHRDVAYRYDRSLPLLWEALRPGGPLVRPRPGPHRARPGRRGGGSPAALHRRAPSPGARRRSGEAAGPAGLHRRGTAPYIIEVSLPPGAANPIPVPGPSESERPPKGTCMAGPVPPTRALSARGTGPQPRGVCRC